MQHSQVSPNARQQLAETVVRSVIPAAVAAVLGDDPGLEVLEPQHGGEEAIAA